MSTASECLGVEEGRIVLDLVVSATNVTWFGLRVAERRDMLVVASILPGIPLLLASNGPHGHVASEGQQLGIGRARGREAAVLDSEVKVHHGHWFPGCNGYQWLALVVGLG